MLKKNKKMLSILAVLLLVSLPIVSASYGSNYYGYGVWSIFPQITVGNSTGYVKINPFGINLFGKARVLKTFQYSATSAKGAGSAVLGSLGLDSCLIFEDGKSDTATLVIALRNDMDKTVAPNIRIGWSAPVTTGNVTWQLEYLYRGLNEDMSALTPDGTIKVNSTVSTTANGYRFAQFNMIAPDANDRVIQIRITRLGSDAGDTLTNVADFVGVLFEYASDKLGGVI
jgi:hypothetical protein